MKEAKYPPLTNKMRENAIERILARKLDKLVLQAEIAFEKCIVEDWKLAEPYPYSLPEDLAKPYLETTKKVCFGGERIDLKHYRVYSRNNDTWYPSTSFKMSSVALKAQHELAEIIEKREQSKQTLTGLFFGATSIKAIIKDYPDLALFLPGPSEDAKGTSLVDPSIALKVKEMLALEL